MIEFLAALCIVSVGALIVILCFAIRSKSFRPTKSALPPSIHLYQTPTTEQLQADVAKLKKLVDEMIKANEAWHTATYDAMEIIERNYIAQQAMVLGQISKSDH